MGSFRWKAPSPNLPDLIELCRKHQAVLVVDDSHGTGVLGKHGRGTAEHLGVLGEVDMITSTLGKALGGAAGGFVAASAARLRLSDPAGPAPALLQRACRPPSPAVRSPASSTWSSIRSSSLPYGRTRSYFRDQLLGLGFQPLPGETPIIPVILGETAAAIRMSDLLLKEGVFVTGLRLSGGSSGASAGPVPDLGGPYPCRPGPSSGSFS